MFLIGIQLSLNSEREIVKRSVPGAVATGLPLRYDGCEDCDPVATAPGTDLVSHIETFLAHTYFTGVLPEGDDVRIILGAGFGWLALSCVSARQTPVLPGILP